MKKKSKVYFIVFGEESQEHNWPSYLKIGRAVNIKRRVSQFQTPLTFFSGYAMNFDSVSESAYYETFFHHILSKFNHKGEWFKIKNEEDFNEINNVINSTCILLSKVKPKFISYSFDNI